MYKLMVVRDTVRIPPRRFNDPIDEVALEILREEHEGMMNPELGFIIAVIEVKNADIGKLVPGDGGAYHDVEFSVLVFKPDLHEVIEGEVVEVVDFGAFVRLGPIDGLCHVSQITDDYINYDSKRSALLGKETGRVLTIGDRVRARIIAMSIRGGSRSGKLGLTMRQPFLGKLEWIEEDIKKIVDKKKEEKEEEKKKDDKKEKKKEKKK